MTVQKPWGHYTPEFVYVTEFALSCVIGFAILIMFGWHLWSVGQGETSVEVQDNDQYRKIARSRGQVRGSIIAGEDSIFSSIIKEFVNSYDLG